MRSITLTMGSNRRYPREKPPDSTIRHCWVLRTAHERGPWPGLILEWKQTNSGDWVARVVYVPDHRVARSVEAWFLAGLARLAIKAGLDKRVHPHGLRHTLAVDLDNQRVPLRAIADQFGHASTATTDEYLRRLNPTQLVDVMTARRWQDDAR